MYQLMCLELPFEGSNSNRAYHLVINDDYPPPPIESNYSEELKAVVYKMLEKDQYKRIHIEELFENPLFPKINMDQKPFEFFLSGIHLLVDSDDSNKFEKASNLFKASADLGDPRGLWSYGYALAKGYDGKINLSEAMKYFKMSADLENQKESLIMELLLKKDMMGRSIFQKQ
jgi:TPR repeat protein